jgi:biopolymer transport protein ExbD
MPEPRKASGWMSNELRTRFVPKSRMRSGLASISPWLDMVLILFFFLFIETRIVLRPGVIVELPVAGFDEGVSDSMVVVMMKPETPGGSEVVFFDDEPYAVDDEKRMAELGKDFKAYLVTHNDTSLTIYADRHVSHGAVSKLVEISRAVGLERVNMGVKSR